MTIVYTAILGTSDSLKPAPKGADRCVCFVDDPAAYPDPKGWELVRHDYRGDPRREAWRLRCVPHLLFCYEKYPIGAPTVRAETYNRVVWIDASFTLTDLPRLVRDAGDAKVAALRHHRRRTPYEEAAEIVAIGQAPADDVQRQVAAYQKAGYEPSHLSISCVIVRNASDGARRFNETWAEQIAEFPSDNTQVSLDFSAWANGLSIHPLRGTRHENPYAVHDAKDHKKRRKPYVTAQGVGA